MSKLNIKSTTIEKTLDAVNELLKTLVGKPIEEMGLLLADNVKTWRLKNQIRTLQKVKAICNKEGIHLKQINLKVLFPYLEGISLEEDEKIQDIWATLLVNYIDEKKNLQSTVYPEILKQLSSKDVEILEQYYNAEIFYDFHNLPIRKSEKPLEYKVNELANLERLGLIRPILKSSRGGGQGLWSQFYMEYVSIRVSHFGDEFYKACHR